MGANGVASWETRAGGPTVWGPPTTATSGLKAVMLWVVSPTGISRSMSVGANVVSVWVTRAIAMSRARSENANGVAVWVVSPGVTNCSPTLGSKAVRL